MRKGAIICPETSQVLFALRHCCVAFPYRSWFYKADAAIRPSLTTSWSLIFFSFRPELDWPGGARRASHLPHLATGRAAVTT